MAELRTYVFIDSLQPQFASFLATVAKGYLPDQARRRCSWKFPRASPLTKSPTWR